MTSKRLLQILPVTMLLLAAAAFGQSDKVFEQVILQPAKPTAQFTTLGVLPDGHVEFRNATLRMLIATAWNLDENRVTGGPESLDSDRYNMAAVARPGTSQEDLLLMLQKLLIERFRLAIHHAPQVEMVYALTVGKNGPALQPAKGSGSPSCPTVQGDPRQIHLLCHGFSMSDLAGLLPQVAPKLSRSARRQLDQTQWDL